MGRNLKLRVTGRAVHTCHQVDACAQFITLLGTKRNSTSIAPQTTYHVAVRFSWHVPHTGTDFDMPLLTPGSPCPGTACGALFAIIVGPTGNNLVMKWAGPNASSTRNAVTLHQPSNAASIQK